MDTCRVCNRGTSKQFYVQPNYPLVAGPVSATPTIAPVVDLTLGYCFNCGTCTMLGEVADNLDYGPDYTSSNITYGKSPSMDAATREFLSLVKSSGLGKGSKVLEIGCYDGSFMELMADELGYDVVGCDSCAEAVDEAKRNGLKAVADDFKTDRFEPQDMVVMRNVLEHIPHPYSFLCEVKNSLNYGGFVVAEVPDGEFRIIKGILGSIVPEHPCYFGEYSLYNLLSSMFVGVIVHRGDGLLQAIARKPFENTIHRGLSTKRWWVNQRHSKLVRSVVEAQKRYDALHNITCDCDKISIYGANTCTLDLLASNCIRPEQVNLVFDDDPRRWGKYLVNYGTSPVKPLSEVKSLKDNDAILVSSYAHRDKMIANLKQMLSKPFKVIKLYPKVEVQDVG